MNDVNVIHPGMTETDRVITLFQAHAKAQNKTPEQIREESVGKAGLRRIGQPEDVAELALFLASPKARHIQGTAISVDGGSTPGLVSAIAGSSQRSMRPSNQSLPRGSAWTVPNR